jgi:hypothetical protein
MMTVKLTKPARTADFDIREDMQAVREVSGFFGSYFFSADNMRFFKSKADYYPVILRDTPHGKALIFMTSERRDGAPREYSIRFIALEGESAGAIGEINGFGNYSSLKACERDILKIKAGKARLTHKETIKEKDYYSFDLITVYGENNTI